MCTRRTISSPESQISTQPKTSGSTSKSSCPKGLYRRASFRNDDHHLLIPLTEARYTACVCAISIQTLLRLSQCAYEVSFGFIDIGATEHRGGNLASLPLGVSEHKGVIWPRYRGSLALQQLYLAE